MTKATVILIPKLGKDPLDPGSYRPISLLQSDIKILAKALSIRLNKVIASIIHPTSRALCHTNPRLLTSAARS